MYTYLLLWWLRQASYLQKAFYAIFCIFCPFAWQSFSLDIISFSLMRMGYSCLLSPNQSHSTSCSYPKDWVIPRNWYLLEEFQCKGKSVGALENKQQTMYQVQERREEFWLNGISSAYVESFFSHYLLWENYLCFRNCSPIISHSFLISL